MSKFQGADITPKQDPSSVKDHGDKGVKSAANAELLTFYQSLIP